ncbi:MAG: DUF4430 domain-containing protein [Oscillospiraceae bacterium]|nr:DUF4430 domain-containing protein [Oscillospiraceae bacterium]
MTITKPNGLRRLLATLLALVMLLGLGAFPAQEAKAAADITVYVSFEGYNLGQGFYIEPTPVTVAAGSKLADASIKLLADTGHEQSGLPTYLEKVKGFGAGEAAVFPEYLPADALEDYIEDDRDDAQWLAAGDYSAMSGWMYTLNDAMGQNGASAESIADGDVIRWEFSVWGFGADLGFDCSQENWGGDSAYYVRADKSALIRALFTDGAEQSAVDDALAVIIDPAAAAETVAQAVQSILDSVPAPAEDWIVITNAASGQLLNNLHAALDAEPYNQGGTYDYSVVTRLKIMGAANITDYTALRNASYAAQFIKELDLSGITATGALNDMGALENVLLPSAAAITTANYFKNCVSLKTVTVSAATTSFGSTTAFSGCTSLESMTFLGNAAPSTFNSGTFTGSNNADSGARAVVAYVPDKTCGGYELEAFTQYFASVEDIAPNPSAGAEEFAALGEAIVRAQAIAPNEAQYTSASWSALQAAVNAAIVAAGNENATSGAVNQARNALENAMNSLQYSSGSGVRIKVTKGAQVAVYKKSYHYAAFTSYQLSLVPELSDDSYDVYSVALTNGNYHIEASIPGVTAKYARYITVAAASQNATYTAALTPLSAWAEQDNGYYDANMYTNLGDTGTVNLSAGGTFDLDTFRVWQAMEGVVNNYFIEPDYTFELFGDSVTTELIGAPGRERLHIAAVQSGVSVVKVTYDPIELYNAAGSPVAKLNGISDSAVGAVVINVGGTAAFDTGITARNDFDVFYFDKAAGSRTFKFTPDAGTAVRVHKPLNISDWGSGWTEYEEDIDGSFTVTLYEGRNIFELKNGGETAYYVLRAHGVSVTVENKNRPGQPFVPGDTAQIKIKGIETAVEKLAGVYNPGYGTDLRPHIKYTDGTATVESAKGGQYSSLTTEFEVEYTISDLDKTTLTGQYWLGLMGAVPGAHRSIILSGLSASMNASAQGPFAFGALPEIKLIPDPEPGDPVTVRTTYQKDDTGLYFIDTALNVESDLSERYGYRDAYNGAAATALDALVAVHVKIYGGSKAQINSNLAVNSVSGSVTKSLGGDAMDDGFSFLVNGIMPYDDQSNYEAWGYSAYTVLQAPLADGDAIQFANMRDSFWTDLSAWFENSAEERISELALKPGEAEELTLMGFAAISSSYGADYIDGVTDPIWDAAITTLLVGDDNGFEYTGDLNELLSMTDEDGKFTLSFDAPGTYYVTAIDGDSEEYIIYPLLIVTVEEQAAWEKALGDVLDYIYATVTAPSVGSTNGEWSVLALARAQYEADGLDEWFELYLTNLLAAAEAKADGNGKVIFHSKTRTDNERVILALSALGKDARDFEELDFVSALFDMQANGQPQSVWQGTNGAAFALIALDSAQYPGDEMRGILVEWLISKQNANGGWAITPGGASTIDMTAMVVQALAPYSLEVDAGAAVERALEWLLAQSPDNSQAFSQIIVALTALGADDEDIVPWIDGLLAYQTESGGFKNVSADSSANQMATEQAAYALTAYWRCKNDMNALYDMTDAQDFGGGPNPEGTNPGGTDPGGTPGGGGTIRVTFTFTGDTHHYVSETEKGIHTEQVWIPRRTVTLPAGSTVKDLTDAQLDEAGLEFTTTSGGGYIAAVNGLSEFDNGPNSGWMYRLNGIIVGRGYAEEVLRNGDDVRWFYTDDYTKESGYENDHEWGVAPGGTGGSSESGSTESGYLNPYIDVPGESWFYDAVQYVTENGIMAGVGGNKFEPQARLTRAMAWTILARNAGEDTSGGLNWYARAMEWAMAQGISDGANPGADITREQLIVMLWRCAGSPAAAGTLGAYSDAGSVSDWARDAMAWAVSERIVNGVTETTLVPKREVTRAETAVMLRRFNEKIK